MRIGILIAVAMLGWVSAARGNEETEARGVQPRLVYEGGYAAGLSDGFALAGGVRLTGRWERLVLGLEFQALMNPSEAVNLEGTVNRWQYLPVVGAGYRAPLGRWTSAYALAIGGAHYFGSMGDRSSDGHLLPTAGVRAGVEYVRGGRVSLTLGASVLALADLSRAHDSVLGREVGGFTALAGVTVGIGFGAVRPQAGP